MKSDTGGIIYKYEARVLPSANWRARQAGDFTIRVRQPLCLCGVFDHNGIAYEVCYLVLYRGKYLALVRPTEAAKRKPETRLPDSLRSAQQQAGAANAQVHRDAEALVRRIEAVYDDLPEEDRPRFEIELRHFMGLYLPLTKR